MNKGKRLRILCLHDINGNSRQMEQSMQPLLLKTEHYIDIELQYLQSPLVTEYQQFQIQKNKSPDKIPVKKDIGWFVKEIITLKKFNKDIGQHYEEKQIKYSHIQKSLNLIREVLDRQGPFDGILGVGQGATIASMLCLKRTNLFEQHADKPYMFNFVILIEARNCNEDPQFSRDYEMNLNNLSAVQLQENLREIERNIIAFPKSFKRNQHKVMQEVQNLDKKLKETLKKPLIDCTEMMSFHVYSQGNVQAMELTQYFCKEKRQIYEFETLEQRIPEKEKLYFQQKGHEIKRNGPEYLTIPSEINETFVEFLQKYKLQLAKLDQQKVTLAPLPNFKQKNSSENKERDGQQQVMYMGKQDFNEVAKYQAQNVFASAKKYCMSSTQSEGKDPCVYQLVNISASPMSPNKRPNQQYYQDVSGGSSPKQNLSSFVGGSTTRRSNNDCCADQVLCEVCAATTSEAVNDLFQEGKRRLQPKQYGVNGSSMSN